MKRKGGAATISVRRAYKFRLYPNAAQEADLYSWLESLRRLYNLSLELRDKAYSAPLDAEIRRLGFVEAEIEQKRLEASQMLAEAKVEQSDKKRHEAEQLARKAKRLSETFATYGVDSKMRWSFLCARVREIDGMADDDPFPDGRVTEYRRGLLKELDESAPESEKSRSLTAFDQGKWLTTHRAGNPWLAKINCQACHQVIGRLDKAFQAFFDGCKGKRPPVGYPRTKKRNEYKSIDFQNYGNGHRLMVRTSNGTVADLATFKVSPDSTEQQCKLGRLRVTGIGSIRVKFHCAIEGKVKQVSIVNESPDYWIERDPEPDANGNATYSLRHRPGRWFAIVSCDLGEQSAVVNTKPTAGICLGPGFTVGTSALSAESIAIPAPMSLAIQRLKEMDRRISSKIGEKRSTWSNNKRKAMAARNDLHQHIANQRRDHHHKLANELLDRFGTIYYAKCYRTPNADRDATKENADGQAGRERRRQLADPGWSAFLTILRYKAAERGAQLVEVDMFNMTDAPSVPLNDHARAKFVLAAGLAGPGRPSADGAGNRPTSKKTSQTENPLRASKRQRNDGGRSQDARPEC